MGVITINMLSRNDLNLEDSMINSIREGYFKCRKFLAQKDLRKKDINGLSRELSSKFFENYSEHKNVLDNSNARNALKNENFVAITFTDGALAYPSLFIKFMAYGEYIGSKEPTDLIQLDAYMKEPLDETLEAFLGGLFLNLKEVSIKLREREWLIMNILTNKEFLYKKKSGNFRILPPEEKEILEVINQNNPDKNVSLDTVQRAKRFLLSYSICWVQTIVVNLSNVGFTYILIQENPKNLSPLLSKFVYWIFPLNSHTADIVLCIPFGNIEDLLPPLMDYLILDSWHWNVNFGPYSTENGWKSFKFPSVNKSFPTKLISPINWNLNVDFNDLSNRDILVLKNLTNTSQLSMTSLEAFMPGETESNIKNSLTKLVKLKIFRLYPQMNFIGANFPVFIGFHVTNSQLYENILNSLLTAPESHIITNQNELRGLGLLKIPPHALHQLVNILRMFQFIQSSKDKIWLYSLNLPYKFNRTINLLDIDFEIKKGIAYLHH